jgi:hypothetical protein
LIFLFLLIPGVLLWYSMTDFPGFRNAFSQRCGGADGDDYFAPYFMRTEFAPVKTSALLSELDPEKKGKLYCSFQADPWSMLFQMLTEGFPGDYCVFDGPARRVEALPDGAFVLLRMNELPENIASRFGGSLKKLERLGRNDLYQLIR